jgi:hypothetical protein
VIALTSDFHVVTSCIATRVRAVLDALGYIAQAGDVCALSGLLICHSELTLSNFSAHSLTGDVAPLLSQPGGVGGEVTPGGPALAPTSSTLIACRSPNIPLR